MYRARFSVQGGDERPAKWPIIHPYWCTGYSGDGEIPIVVAYVESEANLVELWPDAIEIELGDPVTEYQFSDRFPKPSWLIDKEEAIKS